ncbi:MAG TPA: BTAD domain-containing putative transcriptional regulator [Stellaceae bacterium]|nr:BTAD domain-containing putative transcriptional regulator [Stellaceae bacterium]
MMRALDPAGNDILPRAKKTQAVLAYLCLADNQRLPRSRLAGLIWDRSGEKQARESLRKALGELERIGFWHIDSDHESVRLDTTACWIDAFESPNRSDLLLDNLYGISAAFDHWLLGERTRFEVRWQSALERELDALIAGKSAADLRAAAARKLLNFVPTHERAARSLMTAFTELGEPAQAIREYERFRQVVDNSLGMPPSEETVALYRAIRLGTQARSVSAGLPARGLATPPSDPSHDAPAAPSAGQPAEDPQPSIAVLPLRNLSADPAHRLIAEGIVEDLVEALSRLPSLFMISRLSSARFGNHHRQPAEIGAALGARYLISGSMRVSGDRLRLVLELVETESGKALWVASFDERVAKLLDLENGLAEAIVGRIAPRLREAELKRLRIKRPEDYTGYDFFLRAQHNMHSPARAAFESSERFFASAIEREPEYATALAWLAYWHVMRVGQGWSADRGFDAGRAEHFAQRAIECDPLEPMAFAVQGHVAAYLHKDFDCASASFEKALDLNPNCARAWLWSASTHGWAGDGARAVDNISRAMTLSPYDPLACAYSGSASLAYFAAGQYQRSIEFGLRCLRENRAYSAAYKTMIPALVLAGHDVEARTQVNHLLLLEPEFTVQRFRQRFPGGGTAVGEACCKALADAGVPLSG